MASEAQQVVEAISVLFTHPDPQKKAAADSWLTAFTQSDAGWGVSMQLLESSAATEVKFFAANMLLTKSRTSLASLSLQSRTDLGNRLLQLASSDASIPPVLSSRLFLVVAAITLRTNSEAFSCASVISGLLSAVMASQTNPEATARALAVTVGLLQALVDESDRLDGQSLEAAMAALQESMPHILSLFQAYLSAPSPSPLPLLPPILRLLLSLSLDIQSDTVLVSLLPLTTSFRPLWLFLLSSLNTPDADVIAASAELLVVLLGSFPSSLEIASFQSNLSSHDGQPAFQFSEEVVALEVIRAVLDAWDKLPALAAATGSPEEVPDVLAARAKSLCAVIEALSESCPEVFVDPGRGEGVEAAELVLAAVGDAAAGHTEHGAGIHPSSASSLVSSAIRALGGQTSPPFSSTASSSFSPSPSFPLPSPLPLSPCLAAPLEALSCLALDLLQSLNTVPVAERSAPFRGELQRRLAGALLAMASFGPSFSSWDGSSDEEDQFLRFRDFVAVEALVLSAQLQPAATLALLMTQLQVGGGGGGGAGSHMAQLQAAKSWQQAEAAVFGLRSIASVVNNFLSSPSPLHTDFHQAAPSLLASLFSHLLPSISSSHSHSHSHSPSSPPPPWLSSPHPLLLASLSSLISAFAAWLATQPEPLPLSCAAFLLEALRVPEAAPAAATAFKSLSSHCSPLFSSPTSVQHLIALAYTSLPPSSPALPPSSKPKPHILDDLGVRRTVITSLARLAADVQPKDAALQVAASLCVPLVQQAEQCLAEAQRVASGGPANEIYGNEMTRIGHAIGVQFSLLAAVLGALGPAHPPLTRRTSSSSRSGSGTVAGSGSAVRRASVAAASASSTQSTGQDDSSTDMQIALSVMQAASPVVQQVLALEPLSRSSPVAPSLSQLYLQCLVLLRQPLPPFLPPPALLLALLPATREPLLLQLAGLAVELTHAAGGDAGGCAPMLQAATEAAFTVLQGGLLPRESDYIEAFFAMLHRCLLFAPQLVAQPALLPSLLQAAAAVLQHQERDSCRAVLGCLGYLLFPGQGVAGSGAALSSVQGCVLSSFQHSGNVLLTSIVLSSTGNLPRELLRPSASVLYGLLRDLHSAASEWLTATVCTDQFLQRRGSGVQVEAKDVQLFCSLALQQPPMPRPRFEALFTDFCEICRGDGSSDALLGYQM